VSWFTINAVDTKPLVKQLTRVADLLELAITLQYNYTVTVPKDVAPASDEPDSVSYASDEELAKQEMLEEVKRFTAIADDIEKEEE